MAITLLSARLLLIRCGLFPRKIVVAHAHRHFSSTNLNFKQLSNRIDSRILKRKQMFQSLEYVPIARISNKSERYQNLVKRGLIFLASFLLIHFLVIYVRYTKKRNGDKHDVPHFTVETIYDDDLKRKLTVINGYKLPDFVTSKTYDEIFNFRVHPEDVYVVSFPKSGTTWVQEVVYLVNNLVDTEKAKSVNMENRFPYLEYVYPGTKEISKRYGGRLIKSHLPLSLLPPGIMDRKAKIIYIARNPKDTSVSYYHYARMLNEFKYKRSFSEFFERYLEGNVPYGPWWDHYNEFWTNRHESNILFIFYEDLHKDLKGEIRKIAKFLGRTLSDNQVEKIAEHCCFSSMQSNPATNYSWWDTLGLRDKNETSFMRKGKVGDWHNYYTEEQSSRMDKVCTEKFKDTIFFLYDL